VHEKVRKNLGSPAGNNDSDSDSPSDISLENQAAAGVHQESDSMAQPEDRLRQRIKHRLRHCQAEPGSQRDSHDESDSDSDADNSAEGDSDSESRSPLTLGYEMRIIPSIKLVVLKYYHTCFTAQLTESIQSLTPNEYSSRTTHCRSKPF
jgi:hypothetical protein